MFFRLTLVNTRRLHIVSHYSTGWTKSVQLRNYKLLYWDTFANYSLTFYYVYLYNKIWPAIDKLIWMLRMNKTSWNNDFDKILSIKEFARILDVKQNLMLSWNLFSLMAVFFLWTLLIRYNFNIILWKPTVKSRKKNIQYIFNNYWSWKNPLRHINIKYLIYRCLQPHNSVTRFY